MSQLRNKRTGVVVEATGPDAVRAVQSGEWEAVGGLEVQSDHGGVEVTDAARLPNTVGMDPNLGYQHPDEARQLEGQANLQRDFGGGGQQLLTGIEGLASGLTAGGSDWVLDELGANTDKRAEANPGTRGITQGVGMLTGAIAGAGVGGATAIGKALAATPAGLAARAGGAVTSKLGGGIAAQMAGQALEGTLVTAGVAAGEVALRDPELSAEAFIEDIGPAAALGGLLSGGAAGVLGLTGKGLKAWKNANSAEAVSPLVNMNSEAGRKLSTHIADSHAKIDALGQAVSARAGGRGVDKAFRQRAVEDQVDEMAQGVRNITKSSDDLLAEAENRSWLEHESPVIAQGVEFKAPVAGNDAVKPVASADVALYRRALDQEYAAIDDTMSFSKASPAEIRSTRKAVNQAKHEFEAALGKKNRDLDPNDPALAAMRNYENALAEAGKKLDRDSRGAIKTLVGGKSLDDISPPGVASQPGETLIDLNGTVRRPPAAVKPITDALEAARAARLDLDDLGELNAKLLMSGKAEPVIEAYFTKLDDLAMVLGKPPVVGTSGAVFKQQIRKLTGRSAEIGDAAFDQADINIIASLRKKAQKAFGADGPITSEHINRVLRQPPAEFVPKLQALDDYYKGIRQAAKSAQDVKALDQLQDAMSSYSDELAEQAGMKGVEFTPEMMMAALGVSELPSFEGPTDDLLKAGVFISMLSKRGRRGIAQGRSFLGKMARGMFVRGGAGMVANKVGKIANAAGLVDGGRAMAVGAGASAGFTGFGGIYDMVSGVSRSTAGVEATISNTIDALATGVRKAHRVTPTFSALAAKLSLDGKEEKDPQKAYQKVADTLARYATNPMQANEAMYHSLKPLQAVSPHLADELEVKLGMVLQYLYDWMPKDPGTMMFLGKSMWQPTEREMYELEARMQGALAPQSVIAGIAEGVLPPQAAHALREVNPSMFAKFQNDLMARADELRENAETSELVALGIAFDVPLHPSTDGRYVAWIQSAHQTAAGEQQAAMQTPPSGDVKEPTADENYTAAQKMMTA